MDSKNSNKISDIVRLQRILKKWKKLALTNSNSNSNPNPNPNPNTNTKNPNPNTNTKNLLRSSSATMATPKNNLLRTSSASFITTNTNNNTATNGGKSINKFLKRTLSFTDIVSNDSVPKGFLAVDCVGKEVKRFTIPTEYLGHHMFKILLREAEEEFGFQQEGVLKIPCQVSVFEKILKVVEAKKKPDQAGFLSELGFDDHEITSSVVQSCCDLKSSQSNHPQMCR